MLTLLMRFSFPVRGGNIHIFEWRQMGGRNEVVPCIAPKNRKESAAILESVVLVPCRLSPCIFHDLYGTNFVKTFTPLPVNANFRGYRLSWAISSYEWPTLFMTKKV